MPTQIASASSTTTARPMTMMIIITTHITQDSRITQEEITSSVQTNQPLTMPPPRAVCLGRQHVVPTARVLPTESARPAASPMKSAMSIEAPNARNVTRRADSSKTPFRSAACKMTRANPSRKCSARPENTSGQQLEPHPLAQHVRLDATKAPRHSGTAPIPTTVVI